MIVIRGGELYDPAHGVEGEARDLWVDQGHIVPAQATAGNAEIMDARGMIVAPAGVEIHTHVAGSGLNAARRFLLNDCGTLDALANQARFAAEQYLCLGYTTVMDAASAPLFARSTMADLQQMEVVDRGTYTLMGDNRMLLEALADDDRNRIRDTLAWLLEASGGYAVKLVNPGGGLAWKSGRPALELDEPIGLGGLTQRQVLYRVVEFANELGLPHPAHIHAGNLGRPGNYASFLETVRALEGQRAHFCHIQFYAYGEDAQGGYNSAAEQVAEELENHPDLTFDLGQVVFGSALAVSADTSGLDRLRRLTRQPWISCQLEGEGGMSALPLAYRMKDAPSAVQWATGLELMLRFDHPERLFLTTDHPNGGRFTAYPQVIAWLMNRATRQEMLRHVHPAARKATRLAEVDREFNLGEVFAMTSWGPARALGLDNRGHLGVGAKADIRCYRKQENPETMFARPAWVMRNGWVVAREGELVERADGEVLVTRPAWDRERLSRLHNRLAELVSVPVRQYALGEMRIEKLREVACKSTAC